MLTRRNFSGLLACIPFLKLSITSSIPIPYKQTKTDWFKTFNNSKEALFSSKEYANYILSFPNWNKHLKSYTKFYKTDKTWNKIPIYNYV